MKIAIFAALAEASDDVWRSLDDYFDVGGFQPREETITEKLMVRPRRGQPRG